MGHSKMENLHHRKENWKVLGRKRMRVCDTHCGVVRVEDLTCTLDVDRSDTDQVSTHTLGLTLVSFLLTS